MRGLILTLFLSGGGFANEIYQLNSKYRGGNNLIYDCEDMYYACVKDQGRDKCAADRAQAIKNKLDKYPCAVLKEFSKKEDCLKQNYELLKSDAAKRFCYSDGFHH